jgi:hypothetical protein
MQDQPRAGCVGWLVIFNRETDVMVPKDHVLAVGDRFEAIRGNGPREGNFMGIFALTAVDEDGGMRFDPVRE